eukprot:14157733-Alexandrium_andersonii.AAC.1
MDNQASKRCEQLQTSTFTVELPAEYTPAASSDARRKANSQVVPALNLCSQSCPTCVNCCID